MGTSVGSKAISLRQAIIIAAIFEVLGALFAGQEVTSTIQKGTVLKAFKTVRDYDDGDDLALYTSALAYFSIIIWVACFYNTLDCWLYSWIWPSHSRSHNVAMGYNITDSIRVGCLSYHFSSNGVGGVPLYTGFYIFL